MYGNLIRSYPLAGGQQHHLRPRHSRKSRKGVSFGSDFVLSRHETELRLGMTLGRFIARYRRMGSGFISPLVADDGHRRCLGRRRWNDSISQRFTTKRRHRVIFTLAIELHSKKKIAVSPHFSCTLAPLQVKLHLLSVQNYPVIFENRSLSIDRAYLTN